MKKLDDEKGLLSLFSIADQKDGSVKYIYGRFLEYVKRTPEGNLDEDQRSVKTMQVKSYCLCTTPAIGEDASRATIKCILSPDQIDEERDKYIFIGVLPLTRSGCIMQLFTNPMIVDMRKYGGNRTGTVIKINQRQLLLFPATYAYIDSYHQSYSWINHERMFYLFSIDRQEHPLQYEDE